LSLENKASFSKHDCTQGIAGETVHTITLSLIECHSLLGTWSVSLNPLHHVGEIALAYFCYHNLNADKIPFHLNTNIMGLA